MVIKPLGVEVPLNTLFESSVIPYGDQTPVPVLAAVPLFESSVIPYGDQTMASSWIC